jgi:hypothetical protein
MSTEFGKMFVGFDEKDGAALFDMREAAIERAKQMKVWGDDPDAEVWVHREWLPLWFAHLVRDTPLRRLAYTEVK